MWLWLWTLAGCGWLFGPSTAPIDACVAARATQQEARSSDPVPVAKGCAAVYREQGCHDAWLAASEGPTDLYFETIALGCRAAYCDKLDPRPKLCDNAAPDFRAYLLEWPELQQAIWKHDWPESEVVRLQAAFTQRKE
jgi:hypothetical protein